MKKTNLQKRMLTFLDEGVAHFNSTNRCTNENGGCSYYPEGDTKSEGCFIGRRLPKKHIKFIKDKGLNTSDSMFGLLGKGMPLPLIFKGMDDAFLTDCQKLHDRAENWNKKGLADFGKSHYFGIVKTYKLK